MGGVYNNFNLQLYHYAGNNPVKYTDPDGKELKSDYVVNDYSSTTKTTFSNTTTTTVTSIKSFIDYKTLNSLINSTGKAWAAQDRKSSILNMVDSAVNATETGLTVLDLVGLSLIPAPYDMIVTGALLVADFILDSANQNKLENQLKAMYNFENKCDQYKEEDGWEMTNLSVTETVVTKETYHDRNTPFTTTTESQYLELQATFYNKEKDEYVNVYQLMELN